MEIRMALSNREFLPRIPSWSKDVTHRQAIINGLVKRINASGIKSIFGIKSITRLCGCNPEVIAQVFLKLNTKTIEKLISNAEGKIIENKKIMSLETQGRRTIHADIKLYNSFEGERDFLEEVLNHFPEGDLRNTIKEARNLLPEEEFITHCEPRRTVINLKQGHGYWWKR